MINDPEPGQAGSFSLDLIPDPFLILEADGKIYDLNRSCSLLLEAERSALLKRNIFEFQEFSRLLKRAESALAEEREHIERISLGKRNFEVFILPFHTGGRTLIRIVFKDITSFLKLENELLKRNRDLIIMNTLSGAFISSENLDAVLEELLSKVLLIAGFQSGWLLLKEDGGLKLKVSREITQQFGEKICQGALASLCEEALGKKDPLFIIEPGQASKLPVIHEENFVFLVVIPLMSEGLLFLASRVGRDVDFEFASLMSLIGNQVTHITGKLKLLLETERLSVTDTLTGIYNRRYFYKALDLEIARTNRYGEPFSLMLFDIDNFKALNDAYGHQAGDEVLSQLAGILKSVARSTDIIVRYGGEEFIIVLPSTPEEETVFLADRIRAAVQDFSFKGNGAESLKITLSGGIASYPKNAGDAKSLLNAADKALYEAKFSGKNLVFCYEGTLI